MKKIIITIDGYSACGKSTLAKDLADKLKYGYIDTGAMYRAVTFFFLENRVNIQKSAELDKALKKINITFKNTIKGNRTFLNGKDVEDVIRKMFVSKNVSHVAAISAVRKVVVKQQKEMGRNKGIVMEGRDIGTVVFPNAELKLFLTADPDIRTKRRYDELKSKGQTVSLKSIKANLMERDHIDSTRKDSPLKKAKEAIVIDNSNLSQQEQLEMVLALAKTRIQSFSDAKQRKTKTAAQKSTPKKTQSPQKNTSQKRKPAATNTSKATNKKPTKVASKTTNNTSSSKPNPKIEEKTKNNPPSKNGKTTRSTKKNTRIKNAKPPRKKQNEVKSKPQKETKSNPKKNYRKPALAKTS